MNAESQPRTKRLISQTPNLALKSPMAISGFLSSLFRLQSLRHSFPLLFPDEVVEVVPGEEENLAVAVVTLALLGKRLNQQFPWVLLPCRNNPANKTGVVDLKVIAVPAAHLFPQAVLGLPTAMIQHPVSESPPLPTPKTRPPLKVSIPLSLLPSPMSKIKHLGPNTAQGLLPDILDAVVSAR